MFEELDGNAGAGARLIAACLDAAGLKLVLLAGGHVVAASPALERQLAYPPGALDGVSWQQLIATPRHLTFERLSQQLVVEPSQVLTYEIIVVGADSEQQVFEVSHTAVRLPGFDGQMLLLTAPRRDRPLESAEYLSAICSRCGNVRDDHADGRGQGKWVAFLDYVSTYELGRVTHSICPDCAVWLLTQ